MGSREAAAQAIRAARSIVCLTGAGVSAESGVPTFRDAQTGLWALFDPEALASPEGFERDPALVWRWYMWRLDKVRMAQPNPGHLALARLEAWCNAGGDRGPEPVRFDLLTQNVDDLHERAGSRKVSHLHGQIHTFRCNLCGLPWEWKDPEAEMGQAGSSQSDQESEDGSRDHSGPGYVWSDKRPAGADAGEPPRCLVCQGLVRPDVVWFGESLPPGILQRAFDRTATCDLMLVVGTSGRVYPVAQLPYEAKQAGAKIIDINPEDGPISSLADFRLRGTAATELPALLEALEDPSLA